MLRVALIGGSPKKGDSYSKHVLQEVVCELDGSCEMEAFDIPIDGHLPVEELLMFDAWVFAFPVYFQGLPSHVLREMLYLESALKQRQTEIVVYCFLLAEEYEPRAVKSSMEMMENWCAKSFLKWGMGIGIGAGEALKWLDHKHNFGMLSIEETIGDLGEVLLQKGNAPIQYIHPQIPKWIYRLVYKRSFKGLLKNEKLDKPLKK